MNVDRQAEICLGRFVDRAVVISNEMKWSQARVDEIMDCALDTIPDSHGKKWHYRRFCYFKKCAEREKGSQVESVVYTVEDLQDLLGPENLQYLCDLMYLTISSPYDEFEPKSREWFFRQVQRACRSDDPVRYVKRVIRKVLFSDEG